MTASFERFKYTIMKDTLTYWGPGVDDGRGDVAYDAPILMPCRWNDVNEVYTDINGEEKVSLAKIHPDEALELEGLIALGDYSAFTDPLTDLPKTIVFEIQKVREGKSVESEDILETVWV